MNAVGFLFVKLIFLAVLTAVTAAAGSSSFNLSQN